jgi:DNA-binding MarR family transcriptional regulator
MTAPRKAPRPTARAPAGRGVPCDVPVALPSAPEMAQRVTFLVHRVSARIAVVGNRHFRAHDLNHFSARILVLLLEKEELRTGELVDLMVLPQSTISSQLQGLHKKRLIRRRRSRQDNRSVIVTLTEAGRELARDCNELSLRVHEATLRDVSAQDKEIAFSFLRKIDARLAELEKQDLYPFHAPQELEALAGPGDPPTPDQQRRVKRSLATRSAKRSQPVAPSRPKPLKELIR